MPKKNYKESTVYLEVDLKNGRINEVDFLRTTEM